jgi:hypothetical protein
MCRGESTSVKFEGAFVWSLNRVTSHFVKLVLAGSLPETLLCRVAYEGR